MRCLYLCKYRRNLFSNEHVDRHCVPLMLEYFQVHVTIQSRDPPPPACFSILGVQLVNPQYCSAVSNFYCTPVQKRLRCNTYVQTVYPESWSLFQFGTISQYLIYNKPQVNILIVMLHMGDMMKKKVQSFLSAQLLSLAV